MFGPIELLIVIGASSFYGLDRCIIQLKVPGVNQQREVEYSTFDKVLYITCLDMFSTAR